MDPENMRAAFADEAYLRSLFEPDAVEEVQAALKEKDVDLPAEQRDSCAAPQGGKRRDHCRSAEIPRTGRSGFRSGGKLHRAAQSITVNSGRALWRHA